MLLSLLSPVFKKDIAVTVENGVLTVESDREGTLRVGTGNYSRGISKRYFKKSFSISDDVEIRGAELKDGLLRISMEKSFLKAGKEKKSASSKVRSLGLRPDQRRTTEESS